MWLKRLFGTTPADDSEPAKFPSHAVAGNAGAIANRAARPGNTQIVKPAQKAKGFDPYNSGAFRKASAWERVSRR